MKCPGLCNKISSSEYETLNISPCVTGIPVCLRIQQDVWVFWFSGCVS